MRSPRPGQRHLRGVTLPPTTLARATRLPLEARTRSTTAPARLMLPGTAGPMPARAAVPTGVSPSREITPRASRDALREAQARPAPYAEERTPRAAQPTPVGPHPQGPDLVAATLLIDLIDEANAEEARAHRTAAPPDAAELAAAFALLGLQAYAPVAPPRSAPSRGFRATLGLFPLPPSRFDADHQGGTEAGPSGTSGRAAQRQSGDAEFAPWLTGGRPDFAADSSDDGASSIRVGTDGQLLSSQFSAYSSSTDSVATSAESGPSAPSTTDTSFVFRGMLPSQFDGSDGQRNSGFSGHTFGSRLTVSSSGSGRSDDVG